MSFEDLRVSFYPIVQHFTLGRAAIREQPRTPRVPSVCLPLLFPQVTCLVPLTAVALFWGLTYFLVGNVSGRSAPRKGQTAA